MLATANLILLSSLLSVPVSSTPPPAQSYWQVSPPINVNDTLYAGQPQLPVKNILIYNGTAEGRTYSHHAILRAFGSTVYLLHSSGPVDEDQQGEETWTSISHNGGLTWSKTQPLLPMALLPNQSEPLNFTYWCEKKVWQRAIAPISLIPMGGKMWGVAQTAVFNCPDGMNDFRKGAGNIARAIDQKGNPMGEACWVNKNNWTDATAWDMTIYGTQWGMKWCKYRDQINAVLDSPPGVALGSDFLDNVDFYASDNKTEMEEPTHALWIKDRSVRPNGGYWQRFWRGGVSVWVEYSYDLWGRDWYPKSAHSYGNKIYETNIPDRGTKQYLGRLGNGDRYLVHNPRYDASCSSTCDRNPLIVSMSRGKDLSYRWAGVVRTNTSKVIVPGLHKNPGPSYPSAVEADGRLIVGYSENKQNIWISLVDVKDLPGGSQGYRLSVSAHE